MSLTEKIFREWDHENLTSDYDWNKQLDFFFADSGHDECAHRNRIMRLIMEDPIPSRWMEHCGNQTSTESSLSIYSVRSSVMKEARKIYSHYLQRHPKDLDRAVLVFSYWRQKHLEYDYENILERISAKQSLLHLFYRLNVTDTWLDEKMQRCGVSSPSTLKGEYDSETSDGFFASEMSSPRGLILSDEASDQQPDPDTVAEGLTLHPMRPSFHQGDSFDDHSCSCECSCDEECDQSQTTSAAISGK